jgi:formate-dependent nitrite reductase membrane component NrfD
MKEELFISGRNIPNIDPTLHVWHWPIPVYLFLGGLSAGILFFAALHVIRSNGGDISKAMKRALFIPPVALTLGLIALLFDLTHLFYAWQLFTTIRLESPMSWGAWTLLTITPLAFVWALSNIKEILPNWDWKYNWINAIFKFWNKNLKYIAWLIIVLAVILGIYTGILLSAFNARPLWNTSILGPLFLSSALSGGAAVYLYYSNELEQKKIWVKVSILLLVIEGFLFTHMFMGFLASNQVQLEAVEMFLGGEFTVHFWIFDILIGLAIPLALNIIWLKKQNFSLKIIALLILFGGIMMRFTMVHAGQAARYLY